MTENMLVKTLAENTPVIGQSTDTTLESFFDELGRNFAHSIPSIITAVIILVVGLIISKLILRLMQKGFEKGYIDKTVSRFSYSLVKILLYVLVATIVLAVLGVPMSSMIAVIGTAGVTIGLALKDSLSNVAGGFNILITKPFVIGDYVMVDNIEGTVELISIWYTRILTSDNKTVFIPNGQIVASKIINYTLKKTRRVDMTFQISYDNDYKKAERIITDIINNHEKIMKEPEATVKLFSQSESSLDIVCRPWVQSDDYWDVYYDITAQVKDAFDENGIEIPYRQLDVHVK